MLFTDLPAQHNPNPKGQPYTKSALDASDLYGRIAADDKSAKAAEDILLKYGYSMPKSRTHLAHKLASIVMNSGEAALRDLASIHPDKELILSFFGSKPTEEKTVVEVVKEVPVEKVSSSTFQNDCGCGGHMSAEGGYHNYRRHGYYGYAEGLPAIVSDQNKFLKPVALLSLTAVLIAVIVKIK